jgi:hypothetical protein
LPELLNPDIQSLIQMDEAEFNSRFSQNSIGEFRFSMFKRNIEKVLKNIRNKFSGPLK